MISYIFLKLCLDICGTTIEVKLEFYYPLNIRFKLVTLCLIESPKRSEWRTTSSIGLSALWVGELITYQVALNKIDGEWNNKYKNAMTTNILLVHFKLNMLKLKITEDE